MLKADVEDSADKLIIEPDGTVRRDVNVFLTEAQYRKMRAGYLCPWCYQELKHAFKLTCGSWHYGPAEPTQAEWHAFMDEEFRGVEWLGAKPAHQNAIENQWDRDEFVSRTGIWVPDRAA